MEKNSFILEKKKIMSIIMERLILFLLISNIILLNTVILSKGHELIKSLFSNIWGLINTLINKKNETGVFII